MEQPGLIHSRFASQAQATPDALAIAAEGRSLSYAELDLASRVLAGRIHTNGPPQGEVVAIIAERGPEVVAGMLACARSGRPFVVFDLAYPHERLIQLAGICRPSLALLAGSRAGEAAAQLALPTLAVELFPTEHAPALAIRISPDDPAYLLFTSGSTGTPKCLACSHRPLAHFVDWQAHTFALAAEDRFTLLSGLAHDPVLRDIFTPLSLGASLHIPAQEVLTRPGGLHAWLGSARASVAHMTPPLGRLLTAGRPDAELLADLRLVFWGGDVLSHELVDALGAVAPFAESVNFYGSTETPQAVSSFRTRPGAGEGRVPIGRAVDGFKIEIRSEDGRPGFTASGEIVVRSSLLTLGEVRDGQLPSAQNAPRIYATGDIGSRRTDGEVMIHGRRDDQLKVRGYRVELAEITQVALACPEVGQAITLNLGTAEEPRLCCFVQGTIDEADLLQRLAVRLPAYAVPGETVRMDALPLMPNGKIDRQALVASRRQELEPEPASEPDDAAQAALISDWRRIFPGRQVTLNSSFASLAGDSLSYVTAYLSVEQALGRVPDGWTTLAIRELAPPSAGAPTKTLGGVVEVETGILLRALAICAVVASHFGLIVSGSAATSALIWVSGSLFGRLQLKEVERGSSAMPIVRLLKSLLLPLLVIEGPQVLVKFLTHYHARLSSVLMYVDLIDYRGFPASGPDAYGGHEYLMWYVHCLLHILMIFAALAFLFTRVLKVRRPMQATLCAAVALGLAGRFVLPSMLEPGFLTRAVDPLSIFNHSPATFLATFALGACGAMARGRMRLVLLGGALAYAALGGMAYGAADSLSVAGAATLLALLPKLKLPRLLARPVYLTAGASFFIYLLQFKVLQAAGRFPHIPMPVVAASAVGVGIVAWMLWTFGLQKLQGLSADLGPRLGQMAADLRRRWSPAPA
jgi:amino acid adenylation domain-containing protein